MIYIFQRLLIINYQFKFQLANNLHVFTLASFYIKTRSNQSWKWLRKQNWSSMV